MLCVAVFFFFQAEDGIRDDLVTGVQTCALPISLAGSPEAEGFLFEIFRLFRQFSCALLQTIFPRPAPAVRSIPFVCVPFREAFPERPGFLFPSSPFAPLSLRTRAPAARVPSSSPSFPRRSAARPFQETLRVPDPAASAAEPAAPAPRLRQSSPPAKIAAR